jgi:hypothetical protein
MILVDDSFIKFRPILLDEEIGKKTVLSIFGTNLSLEEIRSQISEIRLFQLIPGISIIFFFVTIGFLSASISYALKLILRQEEQFDEGPKIQLAFFIEISKRVRGFLLVTQNIFLLQTILPLGLECFNSYEEKNIETTWTFQDIFGLEQTLFFFLSLFSQLPAFFFAQYKAWDGVRYVTFYWKIICFGLILLAGIITPTVDSYTQLSFASATFSLYVTILNGLEKRIRQANFQLFF